VTVSVFWKWRDTVKNTVILPVSYGIALHSKGQQKIKNPTDMRVSEPLWGIMGR
jgi:hypothetical protein